MISYKPQPFLTGVSVQEIEKNTHQHGNQNFNPTQQIKMQQKI